VQQDEVREVRSAQASAGVDSSNPADEHGTPRALASRL
jgi:hypothetical protein